MRSWNLALVLLLGCVSCTQSPAALIPQRRPASPPPDIGTPADIGVRASSAPEVDVVVACRESGVGISGRGEGQKPPRTDPDVFNRWADSIRERLEAELSPLSAGVGYGVGCADQDRGHRVYVRHYKDIDPVAQRVRAFVVRERLGAHFFVTVMAPAQLL